jgi:hypothetical protein
MEGNMDQLSTLLLNSLKAVQELQIVTVVGQVTVTDAFVPASRRIELAQEQKAMVTSISLLQGDVTNALDEAFTPGKDDALREFHERQVRLGNDIVNRNLRLLKDMVSDIIDVAKRSKDANIA